MTQINNVSQTTSNNYDIAKKATYSTPPQTKIPEALPDSYESKTKPKEEPPKQNNLVRNLAIIGGIIGLGTVGIICHNRASVKNAQKFFSQNLKQTQGNNKVIGENAKKTQEAVEKLIADNVEHFKTAMNTSKKSIVPVNASEILKDGTIYHGANVKNATSILQNGATPYAASTSGQGIGKGFYTTPMKDAAKKYGDVIIPFDANELKIAKLPDGKEKDILAEAYGFLDSCGVPMKDASEYAPTVTKKIFEGLGYNAAYTDKAMTEGLLSGLLSDTKPLQKAGQLAIFDGSKIKVNKNILEELNPINKDNYFKFQS